MYEKFGAVVTGNRVEFKLFLPDNTVDSTQYQTPDDNQSSTYGQPRIQSIQVRGDFQSKLGGTDWELATAPLMQREAHPNGWLYRCSINQDLPEGYYQYKYFVEFENDTHRWCSDPCSKYGGSDEHENAAFVIGGPKTTVNPIGKRLPAKDLILYEVMLDDFTQEFRGQQAPVDAFHSKLDYLQQLGVNAIEFMPLTAWPGGEFSWGYNPVHFFSVEYRYINDPLAPADKLFRLKMLFNELHSRGLHIILDGVFNHVDAGSSPDRGFPYKWLYQDPNDSPFIGTYSRGGFFDNFDYDNTCVQQFIRDICVYWLDTFQVDGFRFDYTLGFYVEGDQEKGITRLVSDLKDYATETQKGNIALFLEHLTDNRYEAIDVTNRIGATGCWFDPFMFQMMDYARNGNIDRENMLRVLNSNHQFDVGKGPVTYIENHDHSTLANVVGRARWYKTQPAAIALLTSPGAVMIHNGQEFGDDHWLPDSGNGRVVPRPLRWKQYGPDSGDSASQALIALYQRLTEIRRGHPALRSPNVFPYPDNHPDGYGAFPETDVVIYHRWGQGANGQLERFIIVVNFSDYDQWVTIPFSANGRWEDVLNGHFVMVSDQRLYNQRINSNWARIYHQGT